MADGLDLRTKEMPHSLGAEQALLACLLTDSDAVTDVIGDLKEEDFYHESHQIIYGAIAAVYNSSRPVELLTVYDRLGHDGNLTKVGDLAYLTELTQMLPSSANVQEYLDMVKKYSTMRKLIRAGRDIEKNARESDDATKSMQYAESLVYNISAQSDTSTMRNIKESSSVDDVLTKFQTIQDNKDALRGVRTGFNEIDRITNGLQKSDLIVIAARPGMGKTSFSMNIVEHAALVEGKVCAVFSLEMPEIQIVQRLICSEAEVSMSRALSGKLTEMDWKALAKAATRIREANINIDDSSRVTPAEILSKCRRIKSRYGALDLVMVDYIQLMSSGRRNEENRVQEVASITRDLKIMAKELDVPVIALSQLRRMDGKPSLIDLRESGAIEQDADIVMFIYNEPNDKKSSEEDEDLRRDIRYVSIAKHRNGETREKIELRFRGELTKFVNPELSETMVTRAEDSAPKPARKYTSREELTPPPEPDNEPGPEDELDSLPPDEELPF
ncbi:MAG: replicative DNA helicase [Clostridia bacterium]|nr:replicative DNA helicase [Clostridia bacterium]